MVFSFWPLIIFGPASFSHEEIASFRFVIWSVFDDDSDDDAMIVMVMTMMSYFSKTIDWWSCVKIYLKLL